MGVYIGVPLFWETTKFSTSLLVGEVVRLDVLVAETLVEVSVVVDVDDVVVKLDEPGGRIICWSLILDVQQ